MAAAAAEAPVRDALAWLLDDAIAFRLPDREGCCEGKEACGDHAADQALADSVSALTEAVESAGDDEKAIAALRALCPLVLAEIRAYEDAEGGARDDG
jgi:hypothetical protein